MGDKTDKEIYLGLAQLSEQSFEKRRDIEWKVGFGFWTAIGIFTWFMVQHPECISVCLIVLLGFSYLIVAIVWTLFWQMPLHSANWQDKEWKHHYAARAVGLETPGRPPNKATGFWENVSTAWKQSYIRPWVWGQTLMTVIFLIISLLVISVANCSREHVQEGVDRLSGQNVRLLLDKIPDARQRDTNIPSDKSVPIGIDQGRQ
jgi:hypothetical protein